jgi:hypothetical protein
VYKATGSCTEKGFKRSDFKYKRFFTQNRILAQKETFKNKAINKLFRKVYKATGSCTEKGFK